MREYWIAACSGKKMEVKRGETITVIDLNGGQVVDFFAETAENPEEFLSTGVTMDCNESIKLHPGDTIYTNLYRPMLKILSDDVGEHDLLHPCCLDNINSALGEKRPIITPVNLFMYTKVNSDGSFSVEVPKSKAGDKVALEALMDLTLGVAACSVSESKCNSGKCSPIRIVIE